MGIGLCDGLPTHAHLSAQRAAHRRAASTTLSTDWNILNAVATSSRESVPLPSRSRALKALRARSSSMVPGGAGRIELLWAPLAGLGMGYPVHAWTRAIAF